MYKIILASSSVNRKALLQRLSLDFVCISPDIDETPKGNEKVEDMVKRLATEKATCVACSYREGLIIGSDQVAEGTSGILGKPENPEDARRQLEEMSGKTVNFHTALCLLNAEDHSLEVDSCLYRVTFRALSAQEIDDYLYKERPLQCAASFRSEKLGVALVEKMEGDDPTALIGLPLIRLCRMLRNQGVKLP